MWRESNHPKGVYGIFNQTILYFFFCDSRKQRAISFLLIGKDIIIFSRISSYSLKKWWWNSSNQGGTFYCESCCGEKWLNNLTTDQKKGLDTILHHFYCVSISLQRFVPFSEAHRSIPDSYLLHQSHTSQSLPFVWEQKGHSNQSFQSGMGIKLELSDALISDASVRNGWWVSRSRRRLHKGIDSWGAK